MRTWNFGKCRRAAVFFRLCLGIIVALTLSLGGMALNTQPAQAIFDISPANITIDAFECLPFVDTQLTVTCCTCSNPPQNLFFWLVDTGGGIPAWVNIDQNTGAISGCPPTPSAGAYTFGVQVSELCVCPNAAGTTCTFGNCFPNGDATLPCVTISPTIANVTLNVAANIPPCVTAINPTFYPVAWEGLPFTMTLSATGGVGPLNWTATPLPAGLTVTDATNGVISGIPGPGTCGIYTVTATVTDTGTCPDPTCCPAISRDFILIVDCWANYLPIFYYTTACDFTVEIGPGLTQGQTNVLFDGTHEATLVGGQSETFISVPCESHLVMVNQTIQVPNSNARFTVIGPNTKTVTDIDNYAYFDYAQEVYIQTASEPSGATQPPGTGFYAVGSNFSSTAPGTIETNIQNGIKYVFREWKLPDGTTRPISNLLFAVNQGGTVTAAYDTFYQLRLTSDYPAIDERSWERKDSIATWNLSLHAVPMLGFWGFLGGVQSPMNASGQQIMNGPATVEIMWRPNYTMPIIAIVIVLLVIVGLVYLIYRLRSKPAAKPVATTRARKASSKAKKRTSR
ncbi:MAG: hypothetical protein FJ023_00010 [Chloroflexi bacterium]|nr:hypothetical protein [Chloroflexota bacterium]